jgi:hypothetical protein
MPFLSGAQHSAGAHQRQPASQQIAACFLGFGRGALQACEVECRRGYGAIHNSGAKYAQHEIDLRRMHGGDPGIGCLPVSPDHQASRVLLEPGEFAYQIAGGTRSVVRIYAVHSGVQEPGQRPCARPGRVVATQQRGKVRLRIQGIVRRAVACANNERGAKQEEREATSSHSTSVRASRCRATPSFERNAPTDGKSTLR